MTAETLTALKASIAHHEENLKAEWPRQVRLGWRRCALCRLHRDDNNFIVDCGECPVKSKTGRDMCEGSPYDDLEDALYSWRYNITNQSNREAFLTAERAEITFLRSLLPEEHA